MLITNNKYFSDYGKLISWKIPVNINFVRIAREVLKKYPPNDHNKEIKNKLIYGKKLETGNYELENIYTRGTSDKAIFYYTNNLTIYHTKYNFNFSVPRSQIIKDSTNELHTPNIIIINDWAYRNCYEESLKRILADWGEMIFGLLKAPINSPMVVNSPYHELIKKIHQDNENQENING